MHVRFSHSTRLFPLTAVLLFGLGACADDAVGPAARDGIRVTMSAAAGDLVTCGQAVPVTATVLNSRGRPVPNFLLNFNVLAGGGSVWGGAALTNSKGIAQEIWTIGGTANVTNTLAVRAVDGTGAGVEYATESATTRSRIAMSMKVENEPDNLDIYTMDPDGGNVQRVTTDPDADAWPSWSPDGSRLVFVRYGTNPGIWVVNADGTGEAQLAGNGNDVDDGPVWSPDGTRIAFHSSRNSPNDIYVMDADGANVERLTTEGGSWPSWSPDGRHIAFQRDVGFEAVAIFVMGADGSGQTRETWLPNESQFPAWSPDGEHIAFNYWGSDEVQIWVMNADGTLPRLLTAGDLRPAWSPDGGKLVFTAGTEAPILATINLDGTGLTPLTDISVFAAAPHWSGCTGP